MISAKCVGWEIEKLRIATKEMEALMEGEEAAEAVSASVGCQP
ncbi:hypothetical protein [Leptolyngbya sp. FACHB-36]|nr:hypothetical protein [Leptolyngbya sp. FACHB-36]